MATSRILIIYTGGTIGMGKNPVTGTLEPLDFAHLVQSMPEFKLIQAAIDVRKFDPPIDSSDMDPMRWAELVGIIANNYADYDGFVILHGTDTMAYTASALSFMLENLTKPVILTGSQLPIGELRTDGKENMMTAIEIASMKNDEGHPVVPEVCIFFNGKLIRGNRAIKVNAEGFHAFESYNHPHLCATSSSRPRLGASSCVPSVRAMHPSRPGSCACSTRLPTAASTSSTSRSASRAAWRWSVTGLDSTSSWHTSSAAGTAPWRPPSPN